MNAYRHTVQYYETDKMGITHHSNYVRWMEEARVDFLAQLGFPYDKLEEMGIISPVISIDCRYKLPTRFAQTITIVVEILEFKGVRLKLRYRMRNEAGEPVCEATSEHCFVNTEGRPIRIQKDYPEFTAALTNNVVPE